MAELTWRDFDPADFLASYWQKRPLLIRNAFAAWENPLEPEELAGLACEEEVESRLIREPRPGEYELEQGPIPEERFPSLPDHHWTLLVQAVDQWVPEVAALVEPFRFLPDWRIDDVMVSYAADLGSVGPHFDQYDVFLIQGLGRRRWRIGQPCNDDTPLLPNPQLRLLQQFETTEEWLLEPGDILYVPPGLAHWGIAEGSRCMTYSVGFRAPGRADLIGDWCDEVLSRLGDDDRYRDGPIGVADNPGEIAPAALQRLQGMVLERLADAEAFARWFGSFATQRRYPEPTPPAQPLTAPALQRRLRSEPLYRHPAGRLAFIREGSDVLFFGDGHCYPAPGELAALAEALCDMQGLEPRQVSAAGAEWLCRLYNEGVLLFDEDDEDNG
jgi:50S ribosomal protein L16 3-hydroxylase